MPYSASRICTLEGCTRRLKGKGLCETHLKRLRTHGSVELRRRRTCVERFFAKVHIGLPECCWEWTGATTFDYGHFVGEGGRHYRAHRWAYEFLVGPIPDGLGLDHLCRNTMCVNPEHLEPVTSRENGLRGVGLTAINAAKTHCPQGHPYDASNTSVDSLGRRSCRTCRRARVRIYKRQRTAKRRATT